MTALRSNNERWGKMDITLVLRKPQQQQQQQA